MAIKRKINYKKYGNELKKPDVEKIKNLGKINHSIIFYSHDKNFSGGYRKSFRAFYN